MKPDLPDQDAVLEFCEVSLNAGAARFNLSLAPGDLALFEAEEAIRASQVGDVALGLLSPVYGRVCFQGVGWEDMSLREAEQCRRTVGRVWGPEEGAAWLQNLDVDENIALAQRFDPGQSYGEVSQRALQVAGSFGWEDLPRMRPAVAKRRTLQVAQWVRAFLPKRLILLILDVPLRGAAEEDAVLLLRNVAEARAQGTAVLWMEKGGTRWQDQGVRPTWHYPDFPVALRPEA